MPFQSTIKAHLKDYRKSGHASFFSLWDIIAPVRRSIIMAMVLAGTAAITALCTLLCLAWIVHTLHIERHRIPSILLLLCIATTVATYWLRLKAFSISHEAAFRLEADIRTSLAKKITRLSLWKAQTLGTGTLPTIMQEDVKSLHVFVADSTPLYARAVVMPLTTFLTALYLDWRLALGMFSVLLAGAAVMYWARRHSAMSEHYTEARERISAAIITFMHAMPAVRMFDGGSSSFTHYQQALKHWQLTLADWYKRAGCSARLSFALISPLPTLLVLVWGGWGLLYAGSALSPSAWVTILLIGSGMAEAVTPMMSLHHLVLRTRMSAVRIGQLLSQQELPQPRYSLIPRDASVTFRHVDFNYSDDTSDAEDAGRPEALYNVSFHAPAGTVTALVGSSGAGKSTAARLLYRFADVKAGRIDIGGVDIRAMTTDTLMQHIAYVSQETFLFSDTIANNIRAGMPTLEKNATGQHGINQASSEQNCTGQKEIIAAARIACAHDFIQQLPLGYDTHISERGTSLSGGQRQRLAVARALLQKRPLLILDEVTAFLDTEKETTLVASLREALKGSTLFLITHKASLAASADQVVFFAKGTVAAQGRHDVLMASMPDYAALWTQHH